MQTFSNLLCYIVNVSFDQGCVPDQHKPAKVILVLKTGDTLISNYRPISILPVFSQISEKFERLMFNGLINYITKPNSCLISNLDI